MNSTSFKHHKKVIFFLFLILILQCKTKKTPILNDNFIWVDFKKYQCENGTLNCFKIDPSDTLNIDQLNKVTKTVLINNFKFEEGYYYKLKVEKKSNYQYNFISEIERKSAQQMFLTGKWKLIEINNKLLSELTTNKFLKTPIIDFNIIENSFRGNDGCNQIGGKIFNINSNTIQFKDIFNTKMLCADMTITNLFHNNIYEIENYKVLNGILILFNKENHQVFKFEQI